MTRKPVAILFVLSLAVLALAVLPAAGLAEKGGNSDNASQRGGGGGGNKGGGGGGGGKGGGGSTPSSFSLVLVDSADGVPNHGETVTFDISTSEERPFVSLNCYVGGVWVYAASVGFFPDYPWSQSLVLANTLWTSGDADCAARLYTSTDGTRTTTLATLDFHVYA